jgi:starch synthase
LNHQLKVLTASAEIVPYAKTGGLADVTGALSGELADAGVPTIMAIPAYPWLIRERFGDTEYVADLSLPMGGRQVGVSLYKLRVKPLLETWFIRADEYYYREGIYGDERGTFGDNAERFALFSRAILEIARLGGCGVIHLHDWPAAPCAAMLRYQPERYPELAACRTLMTVHNLSYQGRFDGGHRTALELSEPAYYEAFEYYGDVNFLKAGLVCADRLTTVSPTYAEEIKQDSGGFGLDGVLRQRAADLSGIMNGVDYAVWNPATDPWTACRYSPEDLAGKAECKAALQREWGLETAPDKPLVAMVTRLAGGKGLELVMGAGDSLFDDDFQFAMLGAGERHYEEYFYSLPARFPGRVGTRTGFDEALAHRVIAGADILLMPSEREPCGLTQLYALKYGTVPVVRRTGGLADSITSYVPGGQGTGFVFDHYNVDGLRWALREALGRYRQGDEWRSLMLRCMAADHSWNRSMAQYLKLYRELTGTGE